MPADTTKNLACRYYLSSRLVCRYYYFKKHAQPHKSAHRQHKQKKSKLHRVRGRPWQFSAWASVLKNVKKKHGLLWLLISLVSICDWAASCATCRPLNICLLPVGYAGPLWYTAVVHGQTGRRYKCFTFECLNRRLTPSAKIKFLKSLALLLLLASLCQTFFLLFLVKRQNGRAEKRGVTGTTNLDLTAVAAVRSPYKFHPTIIIFSTFWPAGPALLLEPCHTCPRTNLSTDTRLLFFSFFLFFKLSPDTLTGKFRSAQAQKKRCCCCCRTDGVCVYCLRLVCVWSFKRVKWGIFL